MMKRYTALFARWRLLALLVLLTGMVACIRDHLDHCGLQLRFRYLYNVQQADGWANEASLVKVWIFDEEEKFVARFEDRPQQMTADYRMELPPLLPGDYTFVAIAEGSRGQGSHSRFEQSVLWSGCSIDSLTSRLQRDACSENDNRLAALLIGTQRVHVCGVRQEIGIDMMKCTNTFRILLMSVGDEEKFLPDDWDISIEGKNGWLAYDASTYRENHLTYRPYYLEHFSGEELQHEGLGSHFLVAEMSTSRLNVCLAPYLVIRRRSASVEVARINLITLLSLYATEVRKEEWGIQEYLDRQDEYTLTLITDGSTWLHTRIKVNDWVLTPGDVDL